MAANDNQFAFDTEIAREAARRWASEEKSREKKVQARDNGQLEKAESKGRIGKRIEYLLGKVREAGAEGEVATGRLEARLETAEASVEEEDAVTVERVLGETRDFLSIEFLEGGIVASRSVGRIVTGLGNGRSSFGTGFLVAPGLLMTNWHVLKTAESAERSAIEFNYQRDRLGQPLRVEKFALRPDLFFLNDKEYDFALVAVDGEQALELFGYCPLIQREGKILIGDPINIIQHPKGEMKQIVVRENRLLDLPSKPTLDRFAHYAADTEPGSSGSPVFNDQWDVIALHHSGVPATDKQGGLLDLDGNAWNTGDDPARLAWIGNEGIRVSRLVSFIAAASVKENEKGLRDAFIAAGDDPTVVPKPPATPKPRRRPRPIREESRDVADDTGEEMAPSRIGSTQVVIAGESLEVTIPITISVRVGGASRAVSAGGDDAQPIGAESGKPDTNYETRKGFDSRFLGISLPLPKPQNTIMNKVLTLDGGGYELKYHHYSVIMNKSRRIAFVSAVNLDADAPFQHERKGADKWYFDPRVDEQSQAGNEFYAGNPLDRGHLTRRADAAWGRSAAEARRANDDTFHWTNCAPQHEVYNQSTRAEKKGLLLWGSLENHIAEQAEDGLKRLSIFNGPIFRDSGSDKDRAHRGLLLPKEFWKVIGYRDTDGRLKAAAFILSQESLIRSLPEEEFVVGPYKPFQVKIQEIERRTKLDFGDLYKVDPLEMAGAEEAFEPGSEFVPVESLDAVIL